MLIQIWFEYKPISLEFNTSIVACVFFFELGARSDVNMSSLSKYCPLTALGIDKWKVPEIYTVESIFNP